MNKSLAIGTFIFALLDIVLGLGSAAALDAIDMKSGLVYYVLNAGVVIPVAVLAGRRVGRMSHTSLLVASAILLVATMWAMRYILNAVAIPAGGHVGWSEYLHAIHPGQFALDTAFALLVPQAWLAVLNRMAANNSSKPTPLRGAA
ncbi:hypothetical protein [Lysobacter sp. HA35]